MSWETAKEYLSCSVGLSHSPVACNGVSIAILDPTPQVLQFKDQVKESSAKDGSASTEGILSVFVNLYYILHRSSMHFYPNIKYNTDLKTFFKHCYICNVFTNMIKCRGVITFPGSCLK